MSEPNDITEAEEPAIGLTQIRHIRIDQWKAVEARLRQYPEFDRPSQAKEAARKVFDAMMAFGLMAVGSRESMELVVGVGRLLQKRQPDNTLPERMSDEDAIVILEELIRLAKASTKE